MVKYVVMLEIFHQIILDDGLSSIRPSIFQLQLSAFMMERYKTKERSLSPKTVQLCVHVGKVESQNVLIYALPHTKIVLKIERSAM